MKVHFGISRQAEAEYHRLIERLASRPHVRKVVEIGGGANPLLSPEFVRRHALRYTVLDISAEELAKAPDDCEKIVADAASPGFAAPGSYDLAFSQWLAEHVADAEAFHRNVFHMLHPGGMAVHLFPTLYSPPFVINRLLPEGLAEGLLSLLQPHRNRAGKHGKFPAYYRWCRGPSARQIRRFQRLGYRVEEYAGFFGHSGEVAFGAGYLDRIPLLARCHEVVARFLARRPATWLTSIAYVVLKRPGSPDDAPLDEDLRDDVRAPALSLSGTS